MAASQYIKRANVTSEYSPETIQELAKCANDPIYAMRNFFYVRHPKRGKVKFELYDYQVDLVNTIHNNRDIILLSARQTGKTQTIGMYLLWLAMMADKDNPQTILIASKNNSHAIEIMDRIKYTYEELPMWLKPGVIFYNRHSIKFDNGSEIRSESTTEKTGRGLSPTKLYLDELAFINPRIQAEMWASLAPALSTGGGFIISSTPNGDSELYATLWRGAKAGLNNFVPVEIKWDQHPERDESYIADMLGKLGPVKLRQEVYCEFLSSDSLLIDSIKLNQLAAKPPLFEENDFKFWQEIKPSRNSIYLVSVDPATGNGADFSVIEVFEFPSLEQVAEFRTNTLRIPFLYEKIQWILNKLTTPIAGIRSEVFWTFERNGIGEAISALYAVDEKQNPHAELYSPDGNGKMGVYTVNRAKIMAALQFKTLVEKVSKGLTINSEALLFEMKNFVAKAGTYCAKSGTTDDCVMAMLVLTRLLQYVSEFDSRAFDTVYSFKDDPITLASDDVSQVGDDEPIPFGVM